ncbi:MAG: VOC family protein [Pseudomonadaceae bacterium]|nr:VOC family protein [Pseudomonadaceae bacterium]
MTDPANSELGAFSLSLAVRDLAASVSFYQALGFEIFAGAHADNYLMLRNGQHVIGLFQGMFEGNLMTFNPGWDQSGQPIDPFTDVRQLQQALTDWGVKPETQVEGDSGPGSFMVTDPDGNRILFDQHR